MAEIIRQGGYTHYKIGRGWLRWLYARQLVVWFTVAVIIRLSLINQPVWYDEAFTLWLAKLPLAKMLLATAGDVHPPAYYVFAWLSVRAFGASFWAIRLPTLLFGLLSLVLFGLILEKMSLPRRVKNLSVILAILSPFLTHYSVEARMYSLLLFCIVGAVLAVWEGNFTAFGLAIGLGFLTHNMMVIYAPVLALFWLIHNRWPGLLKAGLISGAVYAVWLPFVLKQAQNVGQSFWVQPLTVGRVVGAVYESGAEMANNADTLIFSAMAVFCLLLIGLYQALKNEAWGLVLLAWGPLLIGGVLSILYQPVLLPRVLIGSSPFLIILMAWGFHKLYSDVGGYALPIAGAVTVFVLVANLWLAPSRPNYNKIYARLPISPADNCYHVTTASLVLVSAYVDCNHYIWPHANNLEQSLTNKTKTAMQMDQREFNNIPPGPLWLFQSDGPFNAPAEYAELERILNRYPAPPELLYSQQNILSSQVYYIERR